LGEPERNINRQTASATYHRPFSAGGIWATTAVWGRNVHHGISTNAFLIETNVNLAERNVFLARLESAQKTGEDLVLSSRPDLADRVFNVHKLSFGYLRKLGHLAGFVPAIGIQENVSILPADLKPFYGTRTPAGIAVFINLRAAPMAEHAMGPVSAVQHPGGASHTVTTPAAPAAPAPGHENMPGMQHAEAPAARQDTMPGMHVADAKPDAHAAMPGMAKMSNDSTTRELQKRLMADPVIRARVMADTALRRLMHGVTATEDSTSHPRVIKQKAKPKQPAKKPAKKPVPHDMGKMKM
jgi:hypothetical protein